MKIKDIDLDYLIENHLDFIKEELKYYKKNIFKNENNSWELSFFEDVYF